MRVLHLIGERVDIGGVLSVVRNLQENSRGQGVEHVVWMQRDYVETRRPSLQYLRSTGICADSPSYREMLFLGIAGFFKLRRLLQHESFDILHAHSRGMLPAALGMAMWSRHPVLYTNHGYSRQTWLYRFAARRRNFHTVLLTPSMARHYGIAPSASRVRIISACCANHYFDGELAGSGRWQQERRPLRLVGVGNIVRWKNWSLVLQALASLSAEERKQVEFVHWGPVAPEEDAKAYEHELREFVTAHELAQRVRFAGPTGSIAERLREADWFVLPSVNEPCSVGLIEALALGLPALVTAAGGNLDIVSDGKTGLFFQPNDASDFAAKLRLILSPGFRPFDPVTIRDSVRSRSAAAVTPRYLETYQELIRAGTL